MSQVIDVVNCKTGRRVTYVGLPPAICLRNAYEQYTRDNWQTWNYKDPAEYPIEDTITGLKLGDWRYDSG